MIKLLLAVSLIINIALLFYNWVLRIAYEETVRRWKRDSQIIKEDVL